MCSKKEQALCRICGQLVQTGNISTSKRHMMQKKWKTSGCCCSWQTLCQHVKGNTTAFTHTETHTHSVQVRTKTRLACEGGGSCGADVTLTETKLKIMWSVNPPFSLHLSHTLQPSVTPPSEPQRSRSRLFEEGVGDSASVDDVAALSFAARSGCSTTLIYSQKPSLRLHVGWENQVMSFSQSNSATKRSQWPCQVEWKKN